MQTPLIERMKTIFSEAAVLTFEKMAVVALSPVDAKGSADDFEISAIIGFTGDMAGNCALRLSAAGAQEAANRIAGEQVDSPAEIADGIGELVNMIAGNAKAALTEYSLSLSFPEVIRGAGHEIGFYRHPSTVELLFASDIGNVAVIAAFSNPK